MKKKKKEKRRRKKHHFKGVQQLYEKVTSHFTPFSGNLLKIDKTYSFNKGKKYIYNKTNATAKNAHLNKQKLNNLKNQDGVEIHSRKRYRYIHYDRAA